MTQAPLQLAQEVKVTNLGGHPTKREQTNKRISQAVSKMTEENIQKLREVFALDGTIEEACFYAGIAVSTYYNWIKVNPKLLEEFTALRNRPILAARQEVIKGIIGDKNFAFQYLKSKRRDEFGDRVKLDIVPGKDDGNPNLDSANDKVREDYENKIKINLQNAHDEPRDKWPPTRQGVLPCV